MKVLTLHQPWASLVALGVKTIETRSWSTKYRGPLAIHAAGTTAGFDALPGDCEGTTEGGWRYGYIGTYQAGYCFHSSDEGRRGDTFLVDVDGNESMPLADPPLAAIVATCTLVDVVPIFGMSRVINQPWPADSFVVDTTTLDGCLCLSTGQNRSGDSIEDQRPYGDFAPGRYAWLLADIVAVDPPVPFRGGQGLTKTWEPVAA
jgi:activating signal cointegrator 1